MEYSDPHEYRTMMFWSDTAVRGTESGKSGFQTEGGLLREEPVRRGRGGAALKWDEKKGCFGPLVLGSGRDRSSLEWEGGKVGGGRTGMISGGAGVFTSGGGGQGTLRIPWPHGIKYKSRGKHVEFCRGATGMGGGNSE